MLEEIEGSDVVFIEDELGNRGRFWKEQEQGELGEFLRWYRSNGSRSLWNFLQND